MNEQKNPQNTGKPQKDDGNKQFTTNVKLPKHPDTNFDENNFIKLLAHSVSLSLEEKKKIIKIIPTLSQTQIDELIKIFIEEKQKFDDLAKKHPKQVENLREKHHSEWMLFENELAQDKSKEKDDKKAEEIRKQLGI